MGKRAELNYFDENNKLHETSIGALLLGISTTFDGTMVVKLKDNKKSENLVAAIESVRYSGRCFCTLTLHEGSREKTVVNGLVSSTVLTNRLEVFIKPSNIVTYKDGKVCK